MQKRDILVMTAILVGVAIPVVLVTLLANGTIKFIPGQWASQKKLVSRFSQENTPSLLDFCKYLPVNFRDYARCLF